MKNNFQRNGTESNPQVGDNFENIAFDFFSNKGMELSRQYVINIGLDYKKKHKFDLGNSFTLVECKSMKWREEGKVPSAKLKNWNEAMYYFHLAPKYYKKIFFVEMDFSQKYCKTLLQYYLEHYFHLIPNDVVFYDYYVENKNCDVYTFDEIKKIIR